MPSKWCLLRHPCHVRFGLKRKVIPSTPSQTKIGMETRTIWWCIFSYKEHVSFSCRHFGFTGGFFVARFPLFILNPRSSLNILKRQNAEASPPAHSSSQWPMSIWRWCWRCSRLLGESQADGAPPTLYSRMSFNGPYCLTYQLILRISEMFCKDFISNRWRRISSIIFRSE